MPTVDNDLASSGCFPDLDGLIIASRGDVLAIRGTCKRDDPIGMSMIHTRHLPARPVPDPDHVSPLLATASPASPPIFNSVRRERRRFCKGLCCAARCCSSSLTIPIV